MQTDAELEVGLAEMQPGSQYSLGHLYRSAKEGIIPGAHKVDGVWKVPVSTVHEWRERHCRRARKAPRSAH